MPTKSNSEKSFTREDRDFISQGVRCAGWLYRPQGVSRPPIVVMAHGFGAERAWGLPPYAEKFAVGGMAVLVFDYRSFGDSDGEPRGMVSPPRHLQDWEAALAHVRSMADVNGEKVGLWGSSYSGGHVIVTAARDQRVAAIVSQVPFVDGITSTIQTGILHALQCSVPITRDVFRIITFQKPYYMKMVAAPGEFAIFNTPESLPGFMSVLPEGANFPNLCPARSLLGLLAYRPIASAQNVKCPALIFVGDRDSLIPAGTVEKTASRIAGATVVHLDAGHFDAYTGELFKKVSEQTAEFFARHLLSR